MCIVIPGWTRVNCLKLSTVLRATGEVAQIGGKGCENEREPRGTSSEQQSLSYQTTGVECAG